MSLNKFLTEVTIPCVTIGEDGRIATANQPFLDLLGLHRVTGRKYADLLKCNEKSRWTQLLPQILQGEDSIEDHVLLGVIASVIKFVKHTASDGRSHAMGFVLISNRIEDPVREAGLFPDVHDGRVLLHGISSKHLRMQATIERLEQKLRIAQKHAETDPTTGLNNRAGLKGALQKKLQIQRAESAFIYLAAIDLDDFKAVNDHFGHEMGDELLRVVGKRLSSSDHVFSAARIGGDEFAILVDAESHDPQHLWDTIGRIVDGLWSPVRIGDVEIKVSGSIGVSRITNGPFALDEHLREADLALLAAKRNGKNRVQFFDLALATKIERRHSLERDLRKAIRGKLLTTCYQPVISGRAPDFIGVEVLARWRHEVYGNISPVEFIAIADEIGVLPQLDLMIVEQACAELRYLVERDEIKFVSFNVSPGELQADEYIRRFVDIIERSGISPSRICVEITEESMVDNFDLAQNAILKLKEFGVIVAIDDYGTGYSNLRALLDLPVDVIKIDRSLISDIANNERAMQAALSIVHLGRVFAADIVVEGIENAEQAAICKALGSHYFQGYAISAPLALENLDNWLACNIRSGSLATNLPLQSIAGSQLKLVG